MYDEILVQTNLYATQQRALKNITKPWNPVSKQELLAFIGLNVAMEIVKLPELRNYWSTNTIVSYPWFRSVMSRDCFMEKLRYFHIVDNTTAPSRTDPGYNKIWKIQPIVTKLLERSAELYSPHPQLCVDESMIGQNAILLSFST